MTEMRHTRTDAPSAWVVRFARLIPPGGDVLDLACGNGRHARHLAASGHAVEAVDRDAEALRSLVASPGVHTRTADLECGTWPYEGREFAGIVVANYLHRPLFSRLIDALAKDGVLIYETFMIGNERLGRPSHLEFLLRPGELLDAFGAALAVVAFEQGEQASPRPAVVQRICAVRSADVTRIELPDYAPGST